MIKRFIQWLINKCWKRKPKITLNAYTIGKGEIYFNDKFMGIAPGFRLYTEIDKLKSLTRKPDGEWTDNLTGEKIIGQRKINLELDYEKAIRWSDMSREEVLKSFAEDPDWELLASIGDAKEVV